MIYVSNPDLNSRKSAVARPDDREAEILLILSLKNKVPFSFLPHSLSQFNNNNNQ